MPAGFGAPKRLEPGAGAGAPKRLVPGAGAPKADGAGAPKSPPLGAGDGDPKPERIAMKTVIRRELFTETRKE
jgi:hypothetical protein